MQQNNVWFLPGTAIYGDTLYTFNCHPHILQSTLGEARAIKQQGNELYKQQKFEEAIKCYKEAIKVCPTDKKEDLAIFHQNLAAVYDMLMRLPSLHAAI